MRLVFGGEKLWIVECTLDEIIRFVDRENVADGFRPGIANKSLDKDTRRVRFTSSSSSSSRTVNESDASIGLEGISESWNDSR